MHPFFALGLPHGWELFGIIALVVLLFGAEKIPKLARGLGKSLGEFKKAKDEFEKEIHSAANAEEAKALEAKNTNPTLTPTTPASAVPVEDGLTKKT
jgi:sec-independent protein translocase protein TatA